MPFIEQWRRPLVESWAHDGVWDEKLRDDGPTAGDLCYLYYKEFVEQWRKERRWATVDRLCEKVMEVLNTPGLDDDDKRARRALKLAWDTFFQLEVIAYEEERRLENGDVK